MPVAVAVACTGVDGYMLVVVHVAAGRLEDITAPITEIAPQQLAPMRIRELVVAVETTQKVRVVAVLELS